jgi:hypothetical protein
MTTYMIVHDDFFENFILKVNELLAEGWTLLGGVAIGQIGLGNIYNQAMVR